MKAICIARTADAMNGYKGEDLTFNATYTSYERIEDSEPWYLIRVIQDAEKIQLNPIYINRILKIYEELSSRNIEVELISKSPEVSIILQAAELPYTYQYEF